MTRRRPDHESTTRASTAGSVASAPLLSAALLAVSLIGATFGATRACAESTLSPEVRAQLDTVQQLIDRSEPELALDLLRSLGKGRDQRAEPSPREQMLRGTARIMIGEIKEGAAELEKALQRDPGLRQGWLNLGGLEVAEGKYDAALRAFEKAYELDPDRPDVHLNLGAVLVLLGRRPEAKEHFDRYLALEGGSAEAEFLVASNYVLAKLEHLALEHLEKAIGQDEKMRMRARRDRRFLLLDSLEYKVLLSTDSYQPPADHHSQAAAFRTRYDRTEAKLVYTVLEALRDLDVGYEPEVESTARWALVWGDRGLRIKIYNQDNGTGVVRLTAPPGSFTPDGWQRVSQEILRRTHDLLGE